MIKHLIITLVGLTLIYTSHFFMDNSIGEKMDSNLTSYDESKGEAPELVIATKLLGGFRGILIDILWIRAINLEAEGKYFEIAQLFDLISKLEPRIPSVWSYASWNLTYNISKEVPELDQKWEWVKAGIFLLRNKGVKYCPREYKLYDDLAYLFYHKIGGATDDSNDYFKESFASEMDVVFGDNFNINDLLKVSSIEEIKKIKNGNEIFEKLKDPLFRSQIFRILVKQINATPEEEEFLKRYQNEEGFLEVIKYYRKYLIETELCMDIKTIKEVEEKYGKLEWKSGVTHGLYWAFTGIRNATAKQLTTERLETYILKDIFFFGSVYPIYDKRGGKHYEFGPDFSKAEILHKQYIHYLEKYPFDNVTMTFYYAYRAFLETIVIELYMRGELKMAAKYFNEGKIPLQIKEMSMPPTVEEFVDSAFKKALAGRTDQEHIMMIFSPIERYYKDKYILVKPDSDVYFQNFIVKNYREWAEKKKENKLPVPSLKEIQRNVLSRMIKQYGGINQSYLDLMQQEVDKLNAEIGETEKPKPKK